MPVDIPLALELNRSTSPAEAAPLSAVGWRIRRIQTALIACALLAILGAALWVRARTLAAGHASSVAVVPFTTVGGGDQYLADGLTESLTAALGRVPGLRVIASNTAFTYRDRPTLRAIGRELNVGLVVTGSSSGPETA